MPFTNNHGIRIHYETEGTGPPVLLQYGQYFPLDIWYELGYVRALQNDCQLILVDARGHGDSDKPYEPTAYRIELMVNDIISVLDDLGMEKAHYLGYSSGAYLGFAIAKFAQARCYSLILGGTHPYPASDDGSWHAEQIKNLEKQTTADFVAGVEGLLSSLDFPPLSPRMRTGLLKHDLRALIAWHQAVPDFPAFDDILGSISVPCLLYAGENTGEYSGARRAAQEIPGAAFVGIPNGGHLEGGTWIEILRPHILQSVSSTSLPHVS